MTWDKALEFVYHFRNQPSLAGVRELFDFFAKERLLFNRDTATSFAGVVTAMCERYPQAADSWKLHEAHGPMIQNAYRIANSRTCRESRMWAEYLTNRWIILGTDKTAWELLKLCHVTDINHKLFERPCMCQRCAAQAACDVICCSLEDKRIEDERGRLRGSAAFEDLRLQMARLAKEYSRLTPSQRMIPFELVPFTPQSTQEQAIQLLGGGSSVMLN